MILYFLFQVYHWNDKKSSGQWSSFFKFENFVNSNLKIYLMIYRFTHEKAICVQSKAKQSKGIASVAYSLQSKYSELKQSIIHVKS